MTGRLADPAELAALARELAANDWQVRDLITADGGAGAGTAADRNVVLAIDWPRPAAHRLICCPRAPGATTGGSAAPAT